MFKVTLFNKTVVVANRLAAIPYVPIPGIVTGAIYAAGDAFGAKFTFDVPKQGVIEAAILLDLDDEGIETELWLFDQDFIATADNAPWDPSDQDLSKLAAVISIVNFANANSNQVGINNGLSLPYAALVGKLYCQCVTRGTPTIAASNIPLVTLRIIDHVVP